MGRNRKTDYKDIKSKTTTVSIEVPTAQRFDAYCKLHMKTKSRVASMILDHYLDEAERGKKC